MASSKSESMISKFYANCNVFVTGASGFLGKVLIEKLLRSCPDVAGIYLLIRTKKGANPSQRLEKLVKDSAFDVLRIQQPDFAKKLHPISGDVQCEGLALQPADREFLIKNIDIVFHIAATIRFDDEMKRAVHINVRGTLEILNLCEEMEHLQSVIYTSTAYSHCYRKRIEETFYPTPYSPHTIIKFVNEISNATLNEISSRLLTQGHSTWPNNYTFTKAIAEELVRERKDLLPVGIVRPCIVHCSCNEPDRGWCDNLYSVIGYLIAGMTIMNVAIGDVDQKPHVIPVDYCMNSHIVAAERVARDCKHNVATRKIIYNIVPSDSKTQTLKQLIATGLVKAADYPYRAFPYPCFYITTKSKYYYHFLTIFLHYLPALFADLYIMIKGNKPKLIKVYRKIDKLNKVLSHFTLSTWSMTNDNVYSLFYELNEIDKQLFPIDIDNIDYTYWIQRIPYGTKKYLLKESMDEKSLAADRAMYNKMVIVHRTIITGFYLMVIYLIYYLYTVLFQ